MGLVDVLKDPAKERQIIKDSAALIDSEVASKRGMRAMALKAGYKTVKAIKPGIIEDSVRRLLPAFAPAVDPHYDKAVAGGDLHGYFQKNAGAIADDLLAVTDKKAEGAKQKVMKKVYYGLRGQARDHVVAAVPKLSPLIEKYA